MGIILKLTDIILNNYSNGDEAIYLLTFILCKTSLWLKEYFMFSIKIKLKDSFNIRIIDFILLVLINLIKRLY